MQSAGWSADTHYVCRLRDVDWVISEPWANMTFRFDRRDRRGCGWERPALSPVGRFEIRGSPEGSLTEMTTGQYNIKYRCGRQWFRNMSKCCVSSRTLLFGQGLDTRNPRVLIRFWAVALQSERRWWCQVVRQLSPKVTSCSWAFLVKRPYLDVAAVTLRTHYARMGGNVAMGTARRLYINVFYADSRCCATRVVMVTASFWSE